MIASHFEAMVTALLSAADFRLFRREDLKQLPEVTLNRFVRQAEDALLVSPCAPSLADWLVSPETYDAIRMRNRRSLAALCLGEAARQENRYLPDAAQLIFLLLAEPDWNVAQRRSVPALQSAPDSFAAQTAELLAWAVVLLDKPLEEYAPGLRESVHHACEERALRHLDDPACCEAALRRADAPVFARALTAACLIVPQDESLRWLRLKNAMRIADRCMTGSWLPSAHQRAGLGCWCESACAISDAVLLTDLACAGQSGLRSDEDLRTAMRLPSLLHISGRYFADEKSGMLPTLNGEDLYRIGATFDDDDLCALGAKLDAIALASKDGSPLREDENITSRLLNALWRSSLEKDGGTLPPKLLSAVPALHFYAARPHGDKGFYAALYAGALVLFLDGMPILTLSSSGAPGRSLPEPAGQHQTRFACRDESLRTDGFPTISMDIAPSFPLDASLASWQRTVMLTNSAQTVRLLDAFDFAGTRKKSAMRFVCPARPVVAVGAQRARLALAYIEWDGPTQAHVETIAEEDGQTLYALILEKPEPVAGGCWTCTFTRADAV